MERSIPAFKHNDIPTDFPRFKKKGRGFLTIYVRENGVNKLNDPIQVVYTPLRYVVMRRYFSNIIKPLHEQPNLTRLTVQHLSKRTFSAVTLQLRFNLHL